MSDPDGLHATRRTRVVFVVAVSSGKTELRELLGALLELGLRVHGPLTPNDARGYPWEPGGVALLDLRVV